MNKIQNYESVTSITMFPTACVKCQIGQDWYKCQFECEFVPEKCYPDYMEVEDYIIKHIDGEELNIEQAARMLYDHLKQYEPKYLRIANHIRGCKTHFDVDVVIE